MFSYHALLTFVWLLKLASGNSVFLQFNLVQTVNQSTYGFLNPTISKVYLDYLYVCQGGYRILKVNVKSGVVQGHLMAGTVYPITDFIIYSNGQRIVACFWDNRIVVWDSSNFSQIVNTVTSSKCNSILYLDNVDRFLWTQRNNQSLVLATTSLQIQLYLQNTVNNLDNKIYLSPKSSHRSQYLWLRSNNVLNGGSFQYTANSISFNSYYGRLKTIPYLGNRVYTAKGVDFDFYFLTSNLIEEMAYDGSHIVNSRNVSSGQSDLLLAFVQVSQNINVVAYTTKSSQKTVNFIDNNNLTSNYLFTIPQKIMGLQMTNDKRNIILILQSQIQIYEIVCANNLSYSPLSFECINCPANCTHCDSIDNCSSCHNGFYGHLCTVCHPSCLTCQNSTGCLTCAADMAQVGQGLLCQTAANHIEQEQNHSGKNADSALDFYTREIIYYIFSFPSAFRSPLQTPILIAISDLWLYVYHNRTYGQKIEEVFQLIQSIQNKKWAMMQFDKHLNISLDLSYLGFSDYSNYSNPKFLAIQYKSSTFLESMLQFFVYMVPTTLLVFLLNRVIFNTTFKYKISKYFRIYSLNASIFFLLTQGNFEYICYCCFNQSLILFSFSYVDRINTVVWVLCFFFVTVYAFGAFFMFFWFYQKLSKKFIDDAYRIFPSFAIYMLIKGAKIFVLAAIQSFVFQYYINQMFAMIGVHLFLVGTLLYSQIKYGIFKRMICFNCLILQSIVKIIINFLFLIQYSIQEGQDNTFDMIEDCLIIALYVWTIIIVSDIISSILPQTKKEQQLMFKNQTKQIIISKRQKLHNSQVASINKKGANNVKKQKKGKKMVIFGNIQPLIKGNSFQQASFKQQNQLKQLKISKLYSLINQIKQSGKNVNNVNRVDIKKQLLCRNRRQNALRIENRQKVAIQIQGSEDEDEVEQININVIKLQKRNGNLEFKNKIAL